MQAELEEAADTLTSFLRTSWTSAWKSDILPGQP